MNRDPSGAFLPPLSVVFDDAFEGLAFIRVSDGHILAVNDAWLAITGYEREEVIGRTGLELDLWPDPEDRAAVVAKVRAGSAVSGLETPVRTRSGEIRLIEARARTVELGGEEIVFASMRDITDRTAAEDDRRKLVAHFVQAREAERRRVAAELQESTLQTLSAALLRVESLVGSSSDPANAEILRASATALRTTIDGVRRLVFELHPTALEHGLGPALEDLAARRLAPRGVHVAIEDRTGPSLPRSVATSAYRLLREALEALPAGAAAVLLRLDDSDLRIEVRHLEGLGIPVEDLERLDRAVRLAGGSLVADVADGPRLVIEMGAEPEVTVEP